MRDDQSLLETFLARAGVHTCDRGALVRALSTIVASAQNGWPHVSLSADEFVADLADRLHAEPDPTSALLRLHTTDLYLALACARGDPAALIAFEAAFFLDVDAVLVRLSGDSARAEDVKQRLRIRLFVGSDEGSPKISEYSGRGDLKSWFRVAAVRQALSAGRARRREVPLNEALATLTPDNAADPELVHLRKRYRPVFERALKSAVDALSSHERNLLRCHYIERLNIDQIGLIYRVHRVTASRRLVSVRRKVIDGTRRLLGDQLGLSTTEVRSVLNVLRSEMYLNMRSILDVRA
jgi:RNA polymerase sigma-70 factor (ECF subfamily)